MEGPLWAGSGAAAPPPEPRPTFSRPPISVDGTVTATGRPEDSWAGGACLFQNTRHQPGQRAAPSYLQYSKKLPGNHHPFSTRRPEIPHTAARRALVSVGWMLCPSSKPSGAPHRAQVKFWSGLSRPCVTPRNLALHAEKSEHHLLPPFERKACFYHWPLAGRWKPRFGERVHHEWTRVAYSASTVCTDNTVPTSIAFLLEVCVLLQGIRAMSVPGGCVSSW